MIESYNANGNEIMYNDGINILVDKYLITQVYWLDSGFFFNENFLKLSISVFKKILIFVRGCRCVILLRDADLCRLKSSQVRLFIKMH